MDKIKATNDEQIFLEIKVYLVHDIEGFVLLCDNALLHQFCLGGGDAPYGYSQSDYHLIHLTDIHRSYLIYF